MNKRNETIIAALPPSLTGPVAVPERGTTTEHVRAVLDDLGDRPPDTKAIPSNVARKSPPAASRWTTPKDADENYFATCRAHHPAETGSAWIQLATLSGSLSQAADSNEKETANATALEAVEERLARLEGTIAGIVYAALFDRCLVSVHDD